MGVHSAGAKEEIPTPSAQPAEAPGAPSLELLQLKEQTDWRCMLVQDPVPDRGASWQTGTHCWHTQQKDVGQQRAQINPMPVSAPKDIRESAVDDLGGVGGAD